jgi:hypothetical protein
MIRDLRQIIGSHHSVDNPLPILLGHQVRLEGYLPVVNPHLGATDQKPIKCAARHSAATTSGKVIARHDFLKRRTAVF